MRLVTVILVTACVSTVLVFAGPSREAGAIVAVPCYDTPKLCFAAFQIPGGGRSWHLLIEGPRDRYFTRYRLCVEAPDGSLGCDVFRIPRPRHRRFFVSMITWSRHFPNDGPGRYSARWRRLPDHRLIGTRGFTVR